VHYKFHNDDDNEAAAEAITIVLLSQWHTLSAISTGLHFSEIQISTPPKLPWERHP